MTKDELQVALDRAVSRAEYWELQAFTLRVRVRELEGAVRDHKRAVASDVAERASLTVSDRTLWKVLS